MWLHQWMRADGSLKGMQIESSLPAADCPATVTVHALSGNGAGRCGAMHPGRSNRRAVKMHRWSGARQALFVIDDATQQLLFAAGRVGVQEHADLAIDLEDGVLHLGQ